MVKHSNWDLWRLGLWIGPAAFLATYCIPEPLGLSQAAWLTLGIALWMAVWWATEAVPLPATALLPLPLFPLLDIVELRSLAPAYAHPVIFLFFGGFVLGAAMQRWGLHRRIALSILRRFGARPRAQVGGFMLATAFLSMWVSNTATSVMMLPIGISILSHYQGEGGEETNFRRSLLLAIAYSASLGGMATLIGTPPNALLAAYLRDSHGIEIGFAQWMMVGMPVSLCMLAFVWWWLCRQPLPLPDKEKTERTLEVAARELGPLSTAERRVLVVFLLTAAAWIFRPLLEGGLPGLDDTVIAVVAAMSLFILPAGSAGQRLLDWKSAESLPWGVLLLFGGGLALAAVIKSSGLALWIAQSIGQLGTLPTVVVILAVVTVIVFLTELSSNTATTAAFLPLMGALAVAQGLSPLVFAVPAALAASCAFMMPVATPPNAVVFASGQVSIKEMVRAGLAINLFAICLLTLVGKVVLAIATV